MPDTAIQLVEGKLVEEKPLYSPEIETFVKTNLNDILASTLRIWFRDLRSAIVGPIKYSGRQWLVPDGERLVDYVLENQESGKLLYTDNYMKSLTDQITSRILARQARFETRPASTDEDDIQRSKGNNKILKYIFEQRHTKRLLKRHASYITQMGRAYMSAMVDFSHNPKMGPAKVPNMGVPVIGVHSGLEVVCPMEYEDNQSAPFMIRFRRFYRKDAEKRFGRKFDKQQWKEDFPINIMQLLVNDLDYDKYCQDLVELAEFWIHPMNGLIEEEKNPRGLTILFDHQRNEAIEITEWPYPFSGMKGDERKEEAHYPFHDAAFARIIDTNRAFGVCQLLDEKQDDLNRVETMIRYHTNISASPIAIRDPAAMDQSVPLEISAGAIWEVYLSQGKVAPFFMQPPQLNGEVVQLPARIKKDMREIVMVREASLAETGGADSGIALAQLIATDNQNFSHFFIGEYYPALENVCRDILKETIYMPDQFKLELLGRMSGAAQLEEINKQQIDPMTDVFATVGSFEGELPPIKEARLVQRRTQGLISEEDFLYEMDGRDPNEGKLLDIEKAKFENKAAKEGKQVEAPNAAETHSVHIEQHGQVMRSVEYLRWPLDRKKTLADHRQIHVDMNQPQQPVTAQPKPESDQPKPKKDLLADTQLKGVSNMAKMGNASEVTGEAQLGGA